MAQSNCQRSEHVEQVFELQREAIGLIPAGVPLKQYISACADALLAAFQRRDPACLVELSNWHPAFVGTSPETMFDRPFGIEDARLTAVKGHGFASWDEVPDSHFDPRFESAVNAVVEGDIEQLSTLLQQHPSLAGERSPFGHGATLLIYLGANGVETWRQTELSNAVEIAELLLQAGADPNATAQLYGGAHDTISLVETSAHPHAAGVAAALVKRIRGAADLTYS